MITFLWREESMSGMEGVSFKVMLVEDDDGFRRSLAGLLMSRFPSIVLGEAADGAEAMEKVESFVPQLIFMDINLPGQSGLEVTRRLKALHPDIQVVMLTSYDFPEYREAARASGANGFLSKGSSTAEEIQDLVKRLWENAVPQACNSQRDRKEDGNENKQSRDLRD
jgi:DNA-binding NarL/FixJ family response regulator